MELRLTGTWSFEITRIKIYLDLGLAVPGNNSDETQYFLSAVFEVLTLLYPEEWTVPQEVTFPRGWGMKVVEGRHAD
jgi:hypothetical protein